MIKQLHDELKTSVNMRMVFMMHAATDQNPIDIDGAHYAFGKLADDLPKEFPCKQQIGSILTSLCTGKIISESIGGTKYTVNAKKEILLNPLYARLDNPEIQKVIEMEKRFSGFLGDYARIKGPEFGDFISH